MEVQPYETYGRWSGAELVKFLVETRVPLRLSFASNNGPLIVPVWFEYSEGCFFSCSPNNSLLVKSLRKSPEVAFDVSTNDIPYRGVRGRGLASCTTAPDKTALANLLKRYLDTTDNELAQWLLNRTGSEAVIQLDVSWLTSWDFSERMDSIQKLSERDPKIAM